MYAAVGYGSVSVNQVLFKLIDFYKKEMPKPFEVHAGDELVLAGSTRFMLIEGMPESWE